MAFRIDASEVIRERIRQLQAAALLSVQGSQFREGLARLFARLAGDPLAVGEMTYRTPMGHPVFVAVSGPTAINYVVYEVEQAVGIVRVERLNPPNGSHLSN